MSCLASHCWQPRSHLSGIKMASLGLSSSMLWTVILSTALGTLAAHTPLRKLPAAGEVSGVMLYIIVALIEPRSAWLPFWMHRLYTVRLFHTQPARSRHDCSCKDSQDRYRFGSNCLRREYRQRTSATVVAATFEQRLIPTAILMSLLGSLLGSFLGLLQRKCFSGWAE